MQVTLWVDALSPNPGGIGRYTWELCKGLEKRSDVDMRYFGRNRLIKDPASLLSGEPLPARPPPFRKIRAWWERRALGNSLVHGPNYFLPRFAEGGVITVHDLSVFRYPETHPAERRRAFELEFEASLRRATQIITDTETVREELIADFAVDPLRVTAVHLGVDECFAPRDAEGLRTRLAALGIAPGCYALCISAMEPRKKIAELLGAWARLPLGLKAQYPLVLAGGSGWLNEELLRQVEQGVREGWLKHLGFVEEALLPDLYAGAALFLYPSIYEGFGLPPLEAMASGTPVVAAGRSCLPEVCGNAARYVDPDDPDVLLATIVECLSDRDWQVQARQRGLARAGQFRWDRCIDGTVEVYRKAAACS